MNMEFAINNLRYVIIVTVIVCVTTGVYFILGQLVTRIEIQKVNQKENVLRYTLFVRDIDTDEGSSTLSFETKSTQNYGYQMINNKVEVRHVAFLKVHKCASSTAQNIFLRFGYRRYSTFLFGRPTKGQPYENVISFTGTLSDNNTLPPPQNKTFDILCCHVFYNQTAFQKYMPADSVYIGILRDPFEQFLSALKYFRPKSILQSNTNTTDPIMAFLEHPVKYKSHWLTNNMMAKEYGFPDDLFDNYDEEKVFSYLSKLEREFSLIIIVEYFDESLLLLKRLLNWRLKDILYDAKNVHFTENLYITPQQRQRYYSIEKLDTALYQFFFKRFWRQIFAEGNDFFEELLLFKRIQKNVVRFCSKDYKGGSQLVVPESRWEEQFDVTKDDCYLMSLGEINFVRYLKKRQYRSDPSLSQ